MTANLNRQIENFIRDSDMRVDINNRQMNGTELASLYNLYTRIWDTYTNIRKATNIALLSYNIYLWRNSGWNYKCIASVATIGFICLRKTEVYTKAIRWSIGWISGWNNRQTIRTGLVQGRNECLLEVMSAGGVLLGLSWQFSPLTWLMCMPSAITRGLYYGLGLYGLNYILRDDIQQRLIDFLVEILSTLNSNISGVMNNTNHQQSHAYAFEDLVVLHTYPETSPQSCSICMQDDRTHMAQINECHHTFCQECLREWYNKPVLVFNCPLCRINLDTPLDASPVIRNVITQLFR